MLIEKIKHLKRTSYMLNVGSAGEHRLDKLDKLHGETSMDFIKACLPRDKHLTVADVGCGVGRMTAQIARHLEFQGLVYAIDNSEAQLLSTKEHIDMLKIENVKLLHYSAQNMSSMEMKFDVIYCRYLLVHIENYSLVLEQFMKSLNPGGMLIIEEPTMSTSFCYPENNYYMKSRELLERLAQTKRLDFDVGKKLQSVLLGMGANVSAINLAQPILQTEAERSMPALLTDECAKSYLELSLISEKELDKLLEELQQLIYDERYLLGFPRTTQICVTFD